VLVHDLNPDQARALGLDDAALAHRHPHLLSTAITAYPAGHSLQNLPNNDALVLAASGAMHLQPAINRTGPTYIRFPLATQTAAYLGAIGIVAKLLPAQQADTLPQAPGSVKTSLLQGVMTTLLMLQHRASQPTESLAGLPKTLESQIFQCADGLWLHLQSSPEQAPLFAAELARYSAGQLQHALTSNPWYMAFLPRFGLYADIIRRHPRQHWLDDLWASDVAVEAVEPVGKLFRDAQVQHNGYSISVDDARHGPLLQPFSPLHIDPPPRIAHPAPTPGQHSASLLQELEQWLAQTDTPPRATLPGTGAQPQPLAG
jgi:crotonobetainyl-CoA:carnitine CoA-transferase CaiB-like acyl-CoA transferase